MQPGGAMFWNMLPAPLHLVDDYVHFKRLLKAHLFDLSYGTKARFSLPEFTARVDGWPVSITRQHGPYWRVMEIGHPSTWAVNSGSGNRALVTFLFSDAVYEFSCLLANAQPRVSTQSR